MSRNARWGLGLSGLLVTVLAVWWVVAQGEAASGDIVVETEPATRGDVRRIVAASGAVRALVTVEVGSQLSGQVSRLLVDYNDPVEAGQVIAQIDPQSFEIRVREAEATRDTAAASLALQRASLARSEANARAAEAEFERIRTLQARGIAAQSALDTAEAGYDAAQADLGVARAQIQNAQAVLEQREATLENARVDLERTTIRSPIGGIVVDRAVDEGQTVAASMSAPTLFTIAQDLGQVQIDAQVDEADIGQIAEGQPVRFTVDAHPGSELTGQVEQIRLAPQTLNNVVTYTVVVSAANPGQRLLPGMTANMDIITGERTDVLTVPNAALRYRPSPALEDRADPVTEGETGGRGAGGGQGRQGTAVEAVLHHQNARRIAAPVVAVQTRQLDRRLVGFGAGIGEEHLLHTAQRAQARGQFFLGRYPVQVGGVHQSRGLIRQGAGHRRMGVAEVAHGDAGHGVHKTVAVGIV